MLKKVALAASAALLMASTAGVAHANSAKALSLSTSPEIARASSDGSEANEAAGSFLIPAVAVVAIIVGVLVVSGDDSP